MAGQSERFGFNPKQQFIYQHLKKIIIKSTYMYYIIVPPKADTRGRWSHKNQTFGEKLIIMMIIAHAYLEPPFRPRVEERLRQKRTLLGARGRLVPGKVTNGQPTFLANRFDYQEGEDASRQPVFV